MVQDWAVRCTPENALFLTPAQPGGFRIHSRRSVVGEWRDGTQLFFQADFAEPWWREMQDLQPGLAANQRRLTTPGGSLAELSDDQLLDLANRYQADYLVTPVAPDRNLVKVYANARYAVYLPEHPPAPQGFKSQVIWAQEQRFLRQVVYPNIEKYRKSDLTIRLLDHQGRALQSVPYELQLTQHAFGFGASLPFFKRTPEIRSGDFKPKPVDPRELERFVEIFNYSMIPFSGKWIYLEPEEGKRNYEDLDAYVDWCTKHDVRMEYHFISGYTPPWLNKKKPEEQAKLFQEHARDLTKRYGDRIKMWQVVNEKRLLQHAPAVFKQINQEHPDFQLGISDCAYFWTPPSRRQPAATQPRNVYTGLTEVKWLLKEKAPLHYFGFHGHRPFGLWPSWIQMYEGIDTFAREGVKVHITEFGIPLDKPIEGPVRTGRWTAELQAEFYYLFYLVCFSHPAVDTINLFGMGPEVWIAGSGLLDKNYQPTPAFHALKKLIKQDLSTHLTGQLPLDGAITSRVFHGRYRLTITPAQGQIITYDFDLPAKDSTAIFTLQLNAAGNQLQLMQP